MPVSEWVVIKVYIHFELIKLVFSNGNSNNLDIKKHTMHSIWLQLVYIQV